MFKDEGFVNNEATQRHEYKKKNKTNKAARIASDIKKNYRIQPTNYSKQDLPSMKTQGEQCSGNQQK